MLSRIRSLWLAGGGALVLVVALSGVVAAATVMTVLSGLAADPVPQVVDTTATFEDLDGNGTDDDCQTEVVADPVAAASAEAAADLDGDGVISVTEAARSGRVGGKNCNHGGYVSAVARGACTAATVPDSSAAPDASTDADEDAAAACAEVDSSAAPEEAAEPDDATAAECTAETAAASGEPVDPTTSSAAPVDLAPNAHGKAVSEVAKSDAVGGKNCNHGGAVRAAAHKDQDAAKAARNAAKVARDAAREARREAREAAREAARDGKRHGKPAG